MIDISLASDGKPTGEVTLHDGQHFVKCKVCINSFEIKKIMIVFAL